MIDYQAVLIEPVLTEKTNAAREQGRYAFHVAPEADKTMVMEAVRRLFNVTPVSCTVSNVAPKPKRLRSRKGYTSSWKKAVVRLSPGEKIGVFEGA